MEYAILGLRFRSEHLAQHTVENGVRMSIPVVAQTDHALTGHETRSLEAQFFPDMPVQCYASPIVTAQNHSFGVEGRKLFFQSVAGGICILGDLFDAF